jgi:hypothetical protein
MAAPQPYQIAAFLSSPMFALAAFAASIATFASNFFRSSSVTSMCRPVKANSRRFKASVTVGSLSSHMSLSPSEMRDVGRRACEPEPLADQFPPGVMVSVLRPLPLLHCLDRYRPARVARHSCEPYIDGSLCSILAPFCNLRPT